MPTASISESRKTNSIQYQSQITALIAQMTLQEKIGQMSQLSGLAGYINDELAGAIQAGHVGSILNEVDLNTVNELQRIAIEESRLGIPLLIGRDVIHGCKTIFPIPLGQAATWSPELVTKAAQVSAKEASSLGVNWTFAPMIDISRDPRWGRIAESLGEDPYLCSTLGVAMINGFQGNSLASDDSIAACAKHFVGYGASESGRDYASVNLSEHELRNVYLPPFKAAAEAGVATFMAAFSDLNGVPASGNRWLMNDVLREEWQYQGFVVSDWDSISQLSTHGFTENDKSAAYQAIDAGIDMEMVSRTYAENIEQLITDGKIDEANINTMVARILTLKFQLNLFNCPYTPAEKQLNLLCQEHLDLAQKTAEQSCVLLKNEQNLLPLATKQIKRAAIIGPLANDGYEQLGTWIFDGEEKHSVTCLEAIQDYVGSQVEIDYCRALETSRATSQEGFNDAILSAQQADVAILFLGEESILSGEAHCRSSIDLPGCQEELIGEIAKTATPIVLVIMAGRPLTLTKVLPQVDALLYAWHPGTMAGPAICNLIFGAAIPSGKLPVTFPRNVGQIPLYYAQKNTGKPITDHEFVHMNDIPARSPQTSLGMVAGHLDTHFSALFPFGFGLSYTDFSYQNIQLSKEVLGFDDTLTVTVEVQNIGNLAGEDVAQLYVRDLVANVTRPVKELKGFQRIALKAKERKTISFSLTKSDLAFYDRKMQFGAETGQFQLWLGNSSDAKLSRFFTLSK